MGMADPPGHQLVPFPGRLRAVVNLVLLAGAIGCIAVLVRALLSAHAGVGLDQVVTFYVAPAALAGGLLGALRLPMHTRLNVALLVTAVGVSVSGAEAFLVLRSPEQRGLPLVPNQLSLHDAVMDRRARGERVYPRIPGNMLVDASSSWLIDGRWLRPVGTAPGRATVALCNEGRAPVFYEADRYGFNNPDSLWEAGRVDLVMIGDSYVHGICVDPEAQMATRLGKRLRTLNLGVSGAGPLQELAILREYGAHQAPALVVWVFYEGNDLADLRREESAAWLLDYLDASHAQNLRLQQGELDRRFASWVDSIVATGSDEQGPRSLGQLLREVPRLSRLRALLHFGVLFPNDRPPLGSLPDVLLRARSDVEAWGGELLLVYLPAYIGYDVWVGDVHRGREELFELARLGKFRFLDLDSVFRAATPDPRDLWADPRGHLSAAGYRLAAEAIQTTVDSLVALR